MTRIVNVFRFMAFLLIAVLLCSAFSCADEIAADPSAYPLGDANQDGSVDARDALLVLQYAVGKAELPDDAADALDFTTRYGEAYNATWYIDNRVDARDALFVLQLAVHGLPDDPFLRPLVLPDELRPVVPFDLTSSIRLWGDSNDAAPPETMTVLIDGREIPLQPVETDRYDEGTGRSYDVYRVETGDWFTFYAGTNILCGYEAAYDPAVWGRTVVLRRYGCAVANEFLRQLGYDGLYPYSATIGFASRLSAAYDERYAEEFQYALTFMKGDVPTDETMTVRVMTDGSGHYIVSGFSACNAGVFSQNP